MPSMDTMAAQVEMGEIQRFWLMLEQAQACIDERVSSDAWSTTEMRLDRSRLWLARKLPSGLSEGLSIKLAPLFATSHASHKTRLSRRDRLELMYVIAGSSRGIRLECSVNPLARLLDLQGDSPKETLRIAWAGAAGDLAPCGADDSVRHSRQTREGGWLAHDRCGYCDRGDHFCQLPAKGADDINRSETAKGSNRERSELGPAFHPARLRTV